MNNHSPKDFIELNEVLSKKSFRTEHLPFVSIRQIHHWKEIEVLDDHRKYAASGMKSSYSFFEVVWIKIVTEMRSFRISNISIREVKKYLFDTSETKVNQEILVFHKVILKTIIDPTTYFIIIVRDGSVKILDKEVYNQSINEDTIDHHISLRLNILIWEVLSILDFNPDIKSIIQHYKTRIQSS
ncbi:hypothetical protein GCM10022393_28280 [Aquimarina addita]|uniref:Uncharacterized protein n=1 Tax=Aquimarina addita TaxID=870485 RepID=A0ABP6UNR4_9FLAO